MISLRAVIPAVLLLFALVPGDSGTARAADYTVVAADGVSGSDAAAAIRSAGGTVVSGNDAVGVYRVASADTRFAAKAAASPALIGASERRAIGRTTGRPAG
ncbi:serine protease, partial [Actinoplanes sp. NPDC024001]